MTKGSRKDSSQSGSTSLSSEKDDLITCGMSETSRTTGSALENHKKKKQFRNNRGVPLIKSASLVMFNK